MAPEQNDDGSSSTRIILPLVHWPQQDLAAWTSALRATDPFAEGGERAMMRPHSNRRLQASYGRWLGFLLRTGEIDRVPDPAKRIRKETVAHYVRELQGLGNMPSTIALRLTDLVLMARLFAPNEDWCFITQLARRIGAIVAPGKDKRLLLRGSDELFGLGEKLMTDATQLTSLVAVATLFRDGLILASLALMPLRSKNFVQLRIGKELIKNGDNWIVAIPGSSTKTHNPLDFDWPAELRPELNTYLQLSSFIGSALLSVAEPSRHSPLGGHNGFCSYPRRALCHCQETHESCLRRRHQPPRLP